MNICNSPERKSAKIFLPFPPYLPSILLFVFFANCAVDLHGQITFAGQQLEIGPLRSDQVTPGRGAYAGAIGEGNSVSGAGSLAVGNQNVMQASGSNSLLIGEANLGSEALNCALIGAGNSVAKDEEGNPSANSLVTGTGNQAGGTRNGFLAGNGNASGNAENCSALGRQLVNIWEDCTVVGRNNIYQDEAGPLVDAGVLFVVGNGAGAEARTNAFEVYADGTVVIPKRQGDILMGEFGEPE